jgi:hypothetical protein
MKLHVNMPSYPKGTPLEVMGIGPVKNGDVIELTDVQVGALKSAGATVPTSGDMYVYTEAKESAEKEPRTTHLPGIEEVAEKERAKSAPKKEDK